MKKRNPYIVEGTIKKGTVKYRSIKPTIKSLLADAACILLIILMLIFWIYIFYGLGFYKAL